VFFGLKHAVVPVPSRAGEGLSRPA